METDMGEVIIDVRERDEYEVEHVKDSINVPLSVFTTVAPGVLNQLKDRKIQFMCRSGMRAQQAFEQAKGLGFDDAHTYSIYPGGIMAWINAGYPVQTAGKAPLPLMRQMQILMGILFMIFSALGAFVNPWFSTTTIVFGAGLLLAGLTGNCAVAAVLAKAPWNKADPKLKDEFCRASGNCN
jgi:rhodanese-related sulfurtransferase